MKINCTCSVQRFLRSSLFPRILSNEDVCLHQNPDKPWKAADRLNSGAFTYAQQIIWQNLWIGTCSELGFITYSLYLSYHILKRDINTLKTKKGRPWLFAGRERNCLILTEETLGYRQGTCPVIDKMNCLQGKLSLGPPKGFLMPPAWEEHNRHSGHLIQMAEVYKINKYGLQLGKQIRALPRHYQRSFPLK